MLEPTQLIINIYIYIIRTKHQIVVVWFFLIIIDIFIWGHNALKPGSIAAPDENR